MENIFPLCGKTAKTFSIVWKNRANLSTVWKHFFHCVEKSRKVLPLCSQSLTRSPRKRGAIDLAFPLRLAGLGSALGYSIVWKTGVPETSGELWREEGRAAVGGECRIKNEELRMGGRCPVLK